MFDLPLPLGTRLMVDYICEGCKTHYQWRQTSPH